MTRVLIADESVTVRALLRRHLAGEGYEVVEAADGREALAAARRQPPDVVLLGVELPILDGHQVLARLQEDDDLSTVPVVILSSRTGSQEAWDMIKHGAHDELRKPFEAAELTARVAAAARVKSLQDELRRRNIELDLLSRTDPLTGVHNRRHVDEQMGFISSAARRHGQDVSVLMCDIDHFKAINDAHGHAAGDMVLTAIVGRFRACLRTEDVLGRWGGEEFIIVCPFTDLPGATVAAERVRTRVADTPVAIPECEPMSVTVSVGCASGRGEAPDSLVRRADAALFAAKEAGRNLVRTAPAEPPTSPSVGG